MKQPSATSPQTTYEPLTRELIEQIRHYGTHIIGYEKRAETVITLCDMAINALLYAEEIQRLRDTPSETAFTGVDLAEAYLKRTEEKLTPSAIAEPMLFCESCSDPIGCRQNKRCREKFGYAPMRDDDKHGEKIMPWAHPVHADTARGYIVDANGNYVCPLRASRSDEYNAEIAKALNAYATPSATLPKETTVEKKCAKCRTTWTAAPNQCPQCGSRVLMSMVDRFLAWKLPEDFHPDAGISFSPHFNVEYNAKLGLPPARHEPIGTNLLTATQATAMLEHVLSATLPEALATEKLRKVLEFSQGVMHSCPTHPDVVRFAIDLHELLAKEQQ